MTHAPATRETASARRIAASGPAASGPATGGLAASRRAAPCGEEGLEAVFRRAVADGRANGCESIDAWLEAIIDGKVEDAIAEAGWRQCRKPRRCLRAGRCLGA